MAEATGLEPVHEIALITGGLANHCLTC